jgi:hypothetical protein
MEQIKKNVAFGEQIMTTKEHQVRPHNKSMIQREHKFSVFKQTKHDYKNSINESMNIPQLNGKQFFYY